MIFNTSIKDHVITHQLRQKRKAEAVSPIRDDPPVVENEHTEETAQGIPICDSPVRKRRRNCPQQILSSSTSDSESGSESDGSKPIREEVWSDRRREDVRRFKRGWWSLPPLSDDSPFPAIRHARKILNRPSQDPDWDDDTETRVTSRELRRFLKANPLKSVRHGMRQSTLPW